MTAQLCRVCTQAEILLLWRACAALLEAERLKFFIQVPAAPSGWKSRRSLLLPAHFGISLKWAQGQAEQRHRENGRISLLRRKYQFTFKQNEQNHPEAEDHLVLLDTHSQPTHQTVNATILREAQVQIQPCKYNCGMEFQIKTGLPVNR